MRDDNQALMALAVTLAALVALNAALASSRGPDGTECPDKEKWVPAHYMETEDGMEWVDGGCAPLEYKIPEQPLELPPTIVVGHRIPRIPIIHLPPPPPPESTGIPPATIVVPHPPAPKPKNQEQEPAFKFGICSRPLGDDYSKDRTDEEWKRIQTFLDRHDDVTWSKGQTAGGGSWGPWSWNERHAAGLHPANGSWTALLAGKTVPGVVKTASPLPPESACQSRSISEAEYSRVVNKVGAHRSSPPDYNLWTYNCKHWAKTIEREVL